MAKYRIKSLPNNDFQKGGSNSKKDKWGRSPDSKWYGFNPETKQWTLGKPDWKIEEEKKTVKLKKDKWGRPETSQWYGFDPQTKKYTLGEWKGYTNESKKETLDRRNEANQRLEEIRAYKKWEKNADWTDRLAQTFGFGPQNPNYVTGFNPSNENDLLTYFTPTSLKGSSLASKITPYAERILDDVKKLGNVGLKNLVPSSAKNAATIQKYVEPITIGNAARAKTAYDLGTDYLPNLIQGKNIPQNLADVSSSIISLTPLRTFENINKIKNVYGALKYGSKNLKDPRNLENQYKFYNALSGIGGFKNGGYLNRMDDGGSKVKKDKWGRPEGSKWYGFNPDSKKWTLGVPDWVTKKSSNKSSSDRLYNKSPKLVNLGNPVVQQYQYIPEDIKIKQQEAITKELLKNGIIEAEQIRRSGGLDKVKENFIKQQVLEQSGYETNLDYKKEKQNLIKNKLEYLDAAKVNKTPIDFKSLSSEDNNVDFVKTEEQQQWETMNSLLNSLKDESDYYYNDVKKISDKERGDKSNRELLQEDILKKIQNGENPEEFLSEIQDAYDEELYQQILRENKDKPLINPFNTTPFGIFDSSNKLGQFTRDFVADPLNVTEELIWDQDYMPGRAEILRDPSHPLYNYYTKRTQMDKSPLSQMLQYVNPFSSAAESSVALRKGDYGDAALQFGEGLVKGLGAAAGSELFVAGSALPVALPEAIGAATGLTGTTTVGGLAGLGFAGFGMTKLPRTADKIAKAIETGNKEDWREAVNETGLNLLDFVGTGEFLNSEKALAETLSNENRAGKILNQSGKTSSSKTLELEEKLNQIRNQINELNANRETRYSAMTNDEFNYLISTYADEEAKLINEISKTKELASPQAYANLSEEALIPAEESNITTQTSMLNRYEKLTNQYDDLVKQGDELNQELQLDPNITEERYFQIKEKLAEIDQRKNDIVQVMEYAMRSRASRRSGNNILPGLSADEQVMYNQLSNQRGTGSVGYNNMSLNTEGLYASLNNTRIEINEMLKSQMLTGKEMSLQEKARFEELLTTARDLENNINDAQDLLSTMRQIHAQSVAQAAPVTSTGRIEELVTLAQNETELRQLMQNSSDLPTRNFGNIFQNQVSDNLYQRLNNADSNSIRRVGYYLENNTVNVPNYNSAFEELAQSNIVRSGDDIADKKIFNEITEAILNQAKRDGRSERYTEDLRNISKRMFEKGWNWKQDTYTGKSRKLNELEKWYEESKMLNDINSESIEMYESLETSEARKAFLEQLQDDILYEIEGVTNPNNRLFDPYSGDIYNVNYRPFGIKKIKNVEPDISDLDIDFLKTRLNPDEMFKNNPGDRGLVSLGDLSAPVETIKSKDLIVNTKDLDGLISKYQKLYDKLAANHGINDPVAFKVDTVLSDLKSTKWLRTTYVDELKEAGLSADKIKNSSIMTVSDTPTYGISKNLVNSDGEIVGTLNLSPETITLDDGSRFTYQTIGTSAVNFHFHPHSIGGKFAERGAESLEKAIETLTKRNISDAIQQGDILEPYDSFVAKYLDEFLKNPENTKELQDLIVKDLLKNSISKRPELVKQAQYDAKTIIWELKNVYKDSKKTIDQVISNNNNKYGEALYRAVHNGIKDTRGPVGTHQHFVNTNKVSPITGIPDSRPRAQPFWHKLLKDVKGSKDGTSKARFAAPNSARGREKDYGTIILLNRKKGGNIGKLKKFIYNY